MIYVGVKAFYWIKSSEYIIWVVARIYRNNPTFKQYVQTVSKSFDYVCQVAESIAYLCAESSIFEYAVSLVYIDCPLKLNVSFQQ